MENRTSRLRALAMLACGLVMLACTLIFPAQAHAFWATTCYVQDSSGNKAYYADTQAAINDGCGEGKVVVLVIDCEFSETNAAMLQIPAGQKVTINFNGHSVSNAPGSLFHLNENSSLTLQSCDPDAGADSAGKQSAAGVIHNCFRQYGGAIAMEAGSHLTLDNITIKDNESNTPNAKFGTHACGAGIYAEKNCTIDLKNKSQISGNYSRNYGGGIYINGENVKVTLDDSRICDNKAEQGGGIYIDGKNAVIDLKNGSSIDGNTATEAGGGIYCDVSYFTIKSSDGTGKIDGNKAQGSNRAGTKGEQSGGGIHVDAVSGTSEGLIEGLTISNNHSEYDGGGLELDQRWTTVRNCTITGNTCKYEGGGIYDCANHNFLDGCTVTGNACSVNSGGNYEGGGVFVWHSYDIKLSGVCVIKGNTRGKGTDNADDVFLRENAGATAKAYITGTLAAGSSVGVRSGITGDRRVATSFKPASKDCLFYDLDSYYISYGNDEGGDAWQRHRALEFAAKISGDAFGRYRSGAAVALVAPLTKGDDKLFWYWDTKYTTGLNPVGDYITSANMYSNTLAFKMPQNDVDANAVYATRATKVVLGVKAPVAGEDLPTSAVVCRADGIGGTQEFPATVTWYEVGENGEKAGTAAAGKAKAGTVYVASVTCAQSQQGGLCFSKSFSPDGVTIKALSGGDAPAAASTSVDGATGALTVVTETFAKTAGDASAAKAGTVTVKKEKGELKDAASGEAQTASDEPMLLSAADDSQGSEGSLGSVAVSYAFAGGESGEVSVTAPAQEGYNFCNWEGVPEGVEFNDEAGTLTIPESMLGEDLEVTAVYTPVVTKVELSMAAPVAGGDALAGDAGEVWLTCSNGEKVELAELFGIDSLPVTWSPEGEDGKAGYSTAHTAMIKVAEGAEGLVDVDKVVSADAVVVAEGGVEAEGAGFALLDGDLYLCVTFPQTPAVKATAVSQPADVELTFEEATVYQAEQESHPDVTCWPLPKMVNVQLENGQVVDGDVTWDAVEGFDGNATAAQEIVVEGTVRVAHEDEVDTSEVSLNVKTTVRIAAPAQDGEEDGGETPVVNPDEGANQSVSGNKDSKQTLPKTGDSTPAFVAPAVAGVAVIAIAAAAVVARRKRG